MAKLLQLLPFIRCVILTGSMAEGKIKPSSDIDLLIIAKQGRIFSSRFFVMILSYLSGLKRSVAENKNHAGRFCFNYFLSDRFLIIPHNRGERIDKYCAESYSKSKLIVGDQKIFSKFMKNKAFFKKYIKAGYVIARSKTAKQSIKKIAAANGLAMTDNNKNYQQKYFASIFENTLSSGFGDWVERVLKNIQIKKIERDPRVKKYPQLIAFNNRELRFHPPQPHRKMTQN